jgi:hypothetical protein
VEACADRASFHSTRIVLPILLVSLPVLLSNDRNGGVLCIQFAEFIANALAQLHRRLYAVEAELLRRRVDVWEEEL